MRLEPVILNHYTSSYWTAIPSVLQYTEHAGLEISVNSRTASPFSQQIAIGNAGPATALDSMGAKPSFR